MLFFGEQTVETSVAHVRFCDVVFDFTYTSSRICVRLPVFFTRASIFEIRRVTFDFNCALVPFISLISTLVSCVCMVDKPDKEVELSALVAMRLSRLCSVWGLYFRSSLVSRIRIRLEGPDVASGTRNECGRIYTFTILLLRSCEHAEQTSKTTTYIYIYIYIRRKNIISRSVVQFDIINHLQC